MLPALALNYMGQGALLMADPGAIENPFFRLFPGALLWPALALATLAAIIASQAVISGAYSMTRQAMQLGFLPRLTVRHTSARESGQIYMPAVNWVLLAGVLAAALGFGSSSALAGAYGIAVTLTMMITTVLTCVRRAPGLAAAARRSPSARRPSSSRSTRCWSRAARSSSSTAAGSRSRSAACCSSLMATWQRGRAIAARRASGATDSVSTSSSPRSIRSRCRACRASRSIAVADPTTVPQALLHNLKHNRVLHEHNVILTVRFAERAVDRHGGAHRRRAARARLLAREPDLRLHEHARRPGRARAVRFAGTARSPRSRPATSSAAKPSCRRRAPAWRAGASDLFAAMSRNAGSVAAYFRLPDNAVVELGTRVQI